MTDRENIFFQCHSFRNFFNPTSNYEISLKNAIETVFPTGINLQYKKSSINIDFKFIPPDKDPAYCLKKSFTYEGKLKLRLSIKDGNGNFFEKQFNVARIPCPTEESEFIFGHQGKAHRRIMIMQLLMNFGLHHIAIKNQKKSEEENTKLILISKIDERIEIERTQNQVIFKSGSLSLPIEHVKEILFSNNTILKSDSIDLLTSQRKTYYFLEHKGLLDKNQVLIDLENRGSSDLFFVGDKLKEYIESFDITKFGKVRLKNFLNSKIVDVENTKLTIQEFAEILRCYENNLLPITDLRDLKNRRIKLIGDFLYEIFYPCLKKLKEFINTYFEYKIIPEEQITNVLDNEKFQYEVVSRFSSILQDRIDNLFSNQELFQILDTTNPLAEISHKVRITFKGPGGLSEEGLHLVYRDIHESDYCKLCPIETPQGSNLGLNLHLAKGAYINKIGLIERDKNDCSDLFSYAASLIPFIEHNDASRALMAANMMKQAVLLKSMDIPFIKTGSEKEIAEIYLKENDFIQDSHLCLGKNLLVAYMPWELMNFEDSVVISSSCSEKLTAVSEDFLEIEEFSDLKENFRIKVTSNNPFLDPSIKSDLDENGVTNNKELKKGAIIVSMIRENLDPTEKEMQEDISVYAPYDCEIISKDIIQENSALDLKRKILIKLRRLRKAQVGDKLTNRHGNKGVISKILPDREMPYVKTDKNMCTDNQCCVTEPHAHIEVIYNPLGVISRMNFGQLYETNLGWISFNTGKSFTVKPFSKEYPWKKIKEELDQHNLNEKQEVFIYRNEKEHKILNPILVGYQYILRLKHHSEDKLKHRSRYVYDEFTGQPGIPFITDFINRERLKKKVPQRLGEMEVWALEAHGGWNILDELLYLKSDFVHVRGKLTEKQTKLYYPKLTESLKALVHIIRGMGFNMKFYSYGKEIDIFKSKIEEESIITEIRMEIATDSDRVRWASNKEVNSYEFYNEKGLWSDKIFRDKRNDTAYIDLVCPVYNPLLIDHFRTELKEVFKLDDIKFIIEDLFKELGILDIGPQDYINEKNKKKIEFISESKLIKDLKKISNNGKSEKLSEILRVKKIKSINFYEEFINPHSEYSLSPTALYEKIKTLEIEEREYGIKLKDIFMNKLIVIPRSLRWEVKSVVSEKLPPHNDLNNLYKRIILQNERIKNLKKYSAPEIVIQQEEKKLLRYVHALICNGKFFTLIKNSNPLKGLCSLIKGKKGIFRRRLLGKRIDYSGRAVIAPCKELELNQIGLPFDVGISLFEDLLIDEIISRLVKVGTIDKHLKRTKKVLEAKKFLKDSNNTQVIREMLQNKFKGNPVLINRAPTLHRLSILAFYPVFHDDNVIKLNPFTCKPFNADFDGDTMAVYAPLLEGSIAEASKMMPPKSFISPANGSLYMSLGGDVALAVFYLTYNNELVDDESKGIPYLTFSKICSSLGITSLDDRISAISQIHKNLRDIINIEGINTTIGRLIFRSCFPENVKVPNITYDKTNLQNLLGILCKDLSSDKFCDIMRNLKELLSSVLTITGISLGLSDFEYLVPSINKKNINYSYLSKLIDEINKEINTKLEKNSDYPIFLIKFSGASKVDLQQICGIKGYMRRPDGTKVETPILTNIYEGMLKKDYFVSAHGARYGLAEKGIMTRYAGDLTNQLVNAVHDEFITEEDCGTNEGIYFSEFNDWEGGRIPLSERIKGRFLAEDLIIGSEIYKRGSLISEEIVQKIVDNEIKEVKILSPVTCNGRNWKSNQWIEFIRQVKGLYIKKGQDLCEIEEAYLKDLSRKGAHSIILYDQDGKEKNFKIPVVRGICKKCYGIDLATDNLPEIGTPVGVIAAQSIGEPGTQLTLKTFHSGGVDDKGISEGITVARKIFNAGEIHEEISSIFDGKAIVKQNNNGLKFIEIIGKFKDREAVQRVLINTYSPTISEDAESFINENTILLDMLDSQNLQIIDLAELHRKYKIPAQAEYVLYLLQKIYNLHAKVADHHFEVVIRKMFDGDKLVGITRASEMKEGFLGTASYRNTIKLLTEAAMNSRSDFLEGLKEKIITGQVLTLGV